MSVSRTLSAPAIRAVAWAGAALFVVSLTFFLFTYIVTFGETLPGTPAAGTVAANVALFTLFAAHHSVFARERVRAAVARTVPAVLERSVYVWVASLLLIVVCAAWRPLPGQAWAFPGPARWLAYGLQAWGVWLSVRSAAAIDIWDLAGIRQLESGRDAASAARSGDARTAGGDPGGDSPFKTTGPYGWVRHPIYSGWLLIVLGATPMTTSRLVFATVSIAYVLLAIPLEERSLRASSGGAYDGYAARVRWKLIPGVY